MSIFEWRANEQIGIWGRANVLRYGGNIVMASDIFGGWDSHQVLEDT